MAYRTSYGKSEWFNPRENLHKRFYPDNSSRQSAEYAVWLAERDHGKLPEHAFTRIEHDSVTIDGKRQKRARWLVLFKGEDPAAASYWRRRSCQNEEVARYEIRGWDWVPTAREFVCPDNGPAIWQDVAA